MIPNYNFHTLFLTRLSKLLSLIFFVICLLAACSENKNEEIKIVWKDSQAVSILIPQTFLNDLTSDSVEALLRVQIPNQNGISILGETKLADDAILFTPLLPFSRGLSYEIIYRDKEISKIKIPAANAGNAPALLAIYPTQDTLPENLLKLYFQFSSPMREGESLRHISLLNNRNEPVADVFLSLQPELWNTERTALTLWLDPGRIKRDLIPNQKMGNPLTQGERYTLRVASDWRDVQGLPLAQSYNKTFVVSMRDSLSPNVDHWTVHEPPAGTSDPVLVNTHEPLDYFLLDETIQVVDESGNRIAGFKRISHEETQISFIPGKRWKAGRYRLQVASYLEDVAGNNLNKVFDRDITLKEKTQDKQNYEKSFVIK